MTRLEVDAVMGGPAGDYVGFRYDHYEAREIRRDGRMLPTPLPSEWQYADDLVMVDFDSSGRVQGKTLLVSEAHRAPPLLLQVIKRFLGW